MSSPQRESGSPALRPGGPRREVGRRARLLAALAPVGLLLLAPRPGLAAEGAITGATTGPIIWLAFNELPLQSLLDAEGRIDRGYYPNFAALADRSLWARSATTVATRPLDAVPAMLTGLYPRSEREWPVAANHPDTIFTLLQDSHVLDIVETQTLMRPDPAFPSVQGAARSALRDRQIAVVKRMTNDRRRTLDDPARFRRFIAAIPSTHAAAGAERGSLHFINLMFPESPHRYGADGTPYAPYRMFGNFAEIWSDEGWWVEESWRRHILQVRFCDRLLGELIDQLVAAGLYDSSLLIVTGTYGQGFWPGESRLSAGATDHPEDVLSVPLLIKRPGQSSAQSTDALVETIDITPTIADILGVELTWPVDGCSILSRVCVPRTVRKALVRREGQGRRLETFPADLPARRASLDRRISLIGTSATPERLYRFGPHAALAGRKVGDIPRAPSSAGRVATHRQGTSWRSGESGIRFLGALELDRGEAATSPPFVAIAINGVIETIVPAPTEGGKKKGRVVAALLPPESVHGTGDRVELFLVDSREGAPYLRPLVLR